MTFPVEPPSLRSRPRLTWTDQAGSHAIDLEAPVVVGSAPRAELVVADRAVSRLHAELVPREDGLWVRDLGSRNGTFVAGVKVERLRRLVLKELVDNALDAGATDVLVGGLDEHGNEVRGNEAECHRYFVQDNGPASSIDSASHWGNTTYVLHGQS